jgi:hypothetical protein
LRLLEFIKMIHPYADFFRRVNTGNMPIITGRSIQHLMLICRMTEHECPDHVICPSNRTIMLLAIGGSRPFAGRDRQRMASSTLSQILSCTPTRPWKLLERSPDESR